MSETQSLLPEVGEISREYVPARIQLIDMVRQISRTEDPGEYLERLMYLNSQLLSGSLDQENTNYVLLSTKQISDCVGVSYKTVVNRIVQLRNRISNDNSSSNHSLTPITAGDENAGNTAYYNRDQFTLILLDLAISGHREPELLSVIGNIYPEHKSNFDELFMLPTIPEFAQLYGYGASTVNRHIVSLYGNDWQKICIYKIKNGNRVFTLPWEVQEELLVSLKNSIQLGYETRSKKYRQKMNLHLPIKRSRDRTNEYAKDAARRAAAKHSKSMDKTGELEVMPLDDLPPLLSAPRIHGNTKSFSSPKGERRPYNKITPELVEQARKLFENSGDSDFSLDNFSRELNIKFSDAIRLLIRIVPINNTILVDLIYHEISRRQRTSGGSVFTHGNALGLSREDTMRIVHNHVEQSQKTGVIFQR